MHSPSLPFRPRALGLVTPALIGLAACSGADVTTAEAKQAAQERVRQELGLKPDAALFSQVFVGREYDGEPVLCGTVSGQRQDGSELTPRRFIAGTEEGRFLAIDPAHAATYNTANDKFPQWAELCGGANGS